jgi:hypothetical protein
MSLQGERQQQPYAYESDKMAASLLLPLQNHSHQNLGLTPGYALPLVWQNAPA